MPLGEARARAMFGGHGVYLDGQFFAIAMGGRFYFKVDEKSRGRYVEAGMAAFRPFDGDTVLISYFEVPPAVLADPDEVRDWAAESRAAALSLRHKRSPRARRRERV